MEKIVLRTILDPERAAVQDAVIRAVEADPEPFLAAYCEDPRSFGGRYVCADLFKEMFPPYRESLESRNLYNTCVHNAAAVLAAEQFRRRLVINSDQAIEGDTVILLTGIPGAGKTSSILAGGELPSFIQAVFEGQLVNPRSSFPKINQILEAGLAPVVVAVHTLPEVALKNTFQRFMEEGRGAGVGVMADIQGGLPSGLQAIHQKFGEAVALQVMDCRVWGHRETLVGWDQLSVLASEGNREAIKNRLTASLEEYRKNGSISEQCYQQALGEAPTRVVRESVVEVGDPERRQDGCGRELSEEGGGKSFLMDSEDLGVSSSGQSGQGVSPPSCPFPFAPLAPGLYVGTVADIKGSFVLQNTGGGVKVVHQLNDVKGSGASLTVGDLLEVVYRRDGSVKTNERHGLLLGANMGRV